MDIYDVRDFSEYVTERKNAIGGGLHIVLAFPNGYGASVINTKYSHGIELAVLDSNGHITYDTPITNDVLGHLDGDSLVEALRKIKDLKQVLTSP